MDSKHLYELNSSNRSLSLSNEDKLAPLCSSQKPNRSPGRFLHRKDCHDRSFAEALRRKEQSGLPLPKQRKCRTNRWATHCECFSGRSRLHQRLRTWFPRGLNYCGQCDKYTRRKKSHNGRCMCGTLIKVQMMLTANRLSWSSENSSSTAKILDASFQKRGFWKAFVEEVVQ